jgi:polyvinyl alcohol dehydrogenase (cytochrome)
VKHIKSINTALILVLSAGSIARGSDSKDDGEGQWPVAGQNIRDTRGVDSGPLDRDNVKSLTQKWVFTTQGDVSATPTVAGDAVYFPDWAGNLYAVNRKTGQMIWSHLISDYDHVPGAIARVSPAVHGDDLIIGDIESANATHAGANVIAVNRHTGVLRWITQVDSHPAAIITGSPVFLGDIVYVGVSSNEEGLATNPSYPCCSFRGSMVALDTATGKMLWQTFVMPDNGGRPDGYSGGAIWQQPAIDVERGSLYVGTGNDYEVPQSVKNCLSASSMATQSACFAPNDYFDTALSLDLRTGRVKWSKRVQGEDVWTVACLSNPNPVACPEPTSPDYDLGGSGPNLLGNLVGFGQKSGMYWALNPDNGAVVWSSVVGPGATLGGIEWGTASDGKQIYVAISNSNHKPYPLIDGTKTTGGAWSALDAATGRIVWQTADPALTLDTGSVSVANGVVFAGSYSGTMYALNAGTGGVLWSFASGGTVIDGPSIVGRNVYWGSGYKKIAPGTANNKVYAFELAGGDNGHNGNGGE